MQRGSRRFREFLYKGERGDIINHMASIFALEEMVLPIIEGGGDCSLHFPLIVPGVSYLVSSIPFYGNPSIPPEVGEFIIYSPTREGLSVYLGLRGGGGSKWTYKDDR